MAMVQGNPSLKRILEVMGYNVRAYRNQENLRAQTAAVLLSRPSARLRARWRREYWLLKLK
ncbi:MAG: hypothetical protein ACR2M4_05585 [Actinomycetota bacterium]